MLENLRMQEGKKDVFVLQHLKLLKIKLESKGNFIDQIGTWT